MIRDVDGEVETVGWGYVMFLLDAFQVKVIDCIHGVQKPWDCQHYVGDRCCAREASH